jgi:hypothetical protein
MEGLPESHYHSRTPKLEIAKAIHACPVLEIFDGKIRK